MIRRRSLSTGSSIGSFICVVGLIVSFIPSAFATNLPIRGIARGESKIRIGDKAPLTTPELERAHKEGKVIALQLGFSSHCPWCDRMNGISMNYEGRTILMTGLFLFRHR